MLGKGDVLFSTSVKWDVPDGVNGPGRFARGAAPSRQPAPTARLAACAAGASAMDRFDFIRCQPWFEEMQINPAAIGGGAAVHPSALTQALPLLRTSEHAFAQFEVFEGVATFELVDRADAEVTSTYYAAACHGDALADDFPDRDGISSRRIAFRASVLSSSYETRIRLALRPTAGTSVGREHNTDPLSERDPPPPAGSKRRRDASPPDVATELLVRFESAGRALQGRLLHRHVIRMRENVSADGRGASRPSGSAPVAQGSALPSAGAPATPLVRLQLTPHLELCLAALPEHTHAMAAEQMRQLVNRMVTSLAPPAAVPATSSDAAAGGQVSAGQGGGNEVGDGGGEGVRGLELHVGPGGLDERTGHWQAFVRCAHELVDALSPAKLPAAAAGAALPSGAVGRIRSGTAVTPSAIAAGGDGRAATRIEALLSALPIHLTRAMPPTAAASSDLLDRAAAQAAKATEIHANQAIQLLQGGPQSSLQGAEVGEERKRGEEGLRSSKGVVEQMERARAAMKRAQDDRLSALLLPRRTALPPPRPSPHAHDTHEHDVS